MSHSWRVCVCVYVEGENPQLTALVIRTRKLEGVCVCVLGGDLQLTALVIRTHKLEGVCGCVCVRVCVWGGGDPQLEGVCVCVGGEDLQLTTLVIRTHKFWSELVRKQAAGLPKCLGRREPDSARSSSATWKRHSGCGVTGPAPSHFSRGPGWAGAVLC